MVGLSAEAAAKPMTFYFHGSQPLGELDPTPPDISTFRTMDATAPTGADSKSHQLLNYVRGPNSNCAGNPLFPMWVGLLGGEVAGDVKVNFSAAGLPGGEVLIELFTDVEAQACNEEYPDPAASVTVALPAGQGKVEAVIKDVKLKAKGSFMIMFKPVVLVDDATAGKFMTPTSQGRIYYDSTADPSSVSFSCSPKAGKSAC